MRLEQQLYRSYILRMWRDSTGGEWRASVQNIADCETHHFASIHQLILFLCQEVDGEEIINNFMSYAGKAKTRLDEPALTTGEE